MQEADAKFAAARLEGLKRQADEDENITQIQQQAYWAGWHAAMSEAIKVLMRLQSQNPRTPFDKR